MPGMGKGVIFDLDGTLWDANEAMAASYEAFVKKYLPEWYAKGFSVTAEKTRLVCGRPMEEFKDSVFVMFPEELRRTVLNGIWDYEVEFIRENGMVQVFDGVIRMLEALRDKGYGVYIVSNCQIGYIETFLYWSGAADLICDKECNGQTGLTMAENIRLVIQRNQLEQALYVGDTQGDLDGADEAGIPFIHARYGFGDVDRKVPTADTPEEIVRVVEEVFSGQEEMPS